MFPKQLPLSSPTPAQPLCGWRVPLWDPLAFNQGLANFFCKGPDINSLGFSGCEVLVTTGIDNM